MQMSYTLYVCWKTAVNSVTNYVATVNHDFSVLALSLSPAPSSFGHGRFCGVKMNNFVHLLVIFDGTWSYLTVPDHFRLLLIVIHYSQPFFYNTWSFLASVDSTQSFPAVVDSTWLSPVIVFLGVLQSATSSLYWGMNIKSLCDISHDWFMSLYPWFLLSNL
jgi:hypothetical protein